MRSRYSWSCGLLSLLLSAHPWATFGQEANAQEIPTWRLQAEAFGENPGRAVGFYHRLSTRWDWGLQVTTLFSDSDGDLELVQMFADGSSSVTASARESDFFSIRLDADLRRWWQLGEKLGWFAGPRLGGGYTNSSETSTSSANRFELDGTAYFAGAGFTIGADLELLKRLSTTFALVPIALQYRWSDRNVKNLDFIGGLPQTSEEDGEVNDFSIETSFSPTIYLTLAID